MRTARVIALCVVGPIVLGLVLGSVLRAFGALGAETPPATRAAEEVPAILGDVSTPATAAVIPSPAPAARLAQTFDSLVPESRATLPAEAPNPTWSAPVSAPSHVSPGATPPPPIPMSAGTALVAPQTANDAGTSTPIVATTAPPTPSGAKWPPAALTIPAPGASYTDPVFGSVIRRLTNDAGVHSQSDIYVKNGFWNADGTLMKHTVPPGGNRLVIDVQTGATIRSNVPGGSEGSFDPIDPNIWHYVSGKNLMAYDVRTGESTTTKMFGGELGPLGGSVDWIDKSGRYMLLNIANTLRIWDKGADVLYAGAVPANLGGGWAGISPDGNYLVRANEDKHSFKIDHAARTLATEGTQFWTLCGDHGDLISASNGKTYYVTFECHAQAAVYRVDITIPQTAGDVEKQHEDNKMLFDTGWPDSGHFSCVAKGSRQDWCFVSISSSDDVFDDSGPARPYKSEIVMVNVTTGEIRELAHHRSKSTDLNYYYQPRVNVSWDGSQVAWASNFGRSGVSGYTDLYVLDIE